MKILYIDNRNNSLEEFRNNTELTFEQKIDKIMNADEYIILPFNKIYVYMGTYKWTHDIKEVWFPKNEEIVDADSVEAEYKYYMELSTGLMKRVKIGEKSEELEYDSIIITIPNYDSVELKSTYRKNYEKLRRQYFKIGLLCGFAIANYIVCNEDYMLKLFSFDNYLKENQLSSSFVSQKLYDISIFNKSKPSIICSITEYGLKPINLTLKELEESDKDEISIKQEQRSLADISMELRETITGSPYSLDELRRIFINTNVTSYFKFDNKFKCDMGQDKKLTKVNDHKIVRTANFKDE